MHDDFGNLLVASTLLEGRLSNPIPPAWQSLETFHVVFQPSYAAKFPIGLGAMLAFGKLLTGTFAAGLWLCAGLASSCVAWMIRSHFPRRWAMAGGLFTATHTCWQIGWSQEFTNGWLAISGVALVLGGLLRIRRRYRRGQTVFDSRLTFLVGVGCALSLLSRPFEGGLMCGLLGLYFIPTLLTRRLLWSAAFWRASFPGAAVLFAGFCLQLAINRSVTGQYLQLPYQLHETQYGVAPVFSWQAPHEPAMGHHFPEQAKFHREWSMDEYRKAASIKGYFDLLQKRIVFSIKHWGALLAFSPLFLLVLGAERRRFLGLAGLLLSAFLIINFIPWAMSQYVAPLIPMVILIACVVSRGLLQRFFVTFQPTMPRAKIESIALACILLLQSYGTFSVAYARALYRPGWEKTVANHRDAMVRHLTQLPGPDLVLVKYKVNHNVHFEWVFNDANLGNATVVWARWGSEELNANLLHSYSDRKAWKLEFDLEGEPSLTEL